MNSPKIEDIILSELKLIPGELGSVRHGIKSTDPGFSGFEEVYFSSVFFGKTKGWKRHTRMISNLIVISGEITFFLIDKREDSRTYDQNDIIRISADNPRRLTVPPGIWTAFRGNTQG
ncbi:dTDP-4-dehydrorhamnose 3,5-epimerase, partial [Leptospira gomenensis]